MATRPLRAVVEAGYDVALAVTRADKRRGRGATVEPSPVKATALDLGIPVSTNPDEALDVSADLGVVVAFGRIIKPHLLATLPMINVHFSLLPRWRGAAPVERAILAGDDATGVCLMDVVDELDAGDVYACEQLAIGREETADALRARLIDAGTRLLLNGLAHGFGTPQPQQGEPTYADKITSAELRLDWERSALELDRIVRVGGAWTTHRGKRLKIARARVAEPAEGNGVPGTLVGRTVVCGVGCLELVEVQPEGRRRMPIDDWLHGHQVAPGEILGD